MDIYFSRMQELANSGQISSRIQFMLIDIIELRTRKWVTRTQVAAPSTIAEVHQKAERDRQVAEREAALRQAGGRDHARTGRRDTRDPSQTGPDGWTTPAKQPAKAGDLSRFGKISKSTTMAFGPSSVFSNKNEKRESASVTRVSSSSNMFAALNSNEATPDAVSMGSRTANSTRPPSRKASVDFSVSSVTDGRRKLLLQPRTQMASDAGSFRDDAGSAIGQSEQGDDDAASAATSAVQASVPAGMTTEQAKRKIKEDIKELFSLRQPAEAEGYFSLPAEFRWLLVEELVTKAVDGKPADVKLVSDVFSVAVSKSLVDEAQFLQGFAKDMEYLEDTSTDSPNAYANVASLLKAANLSQAAIESLADKIIVEGEMAITPREKLLKKYSDLTT